MQEGTNAGKVETKQLKRNVGTCLHAPTRERERERERDPQ